VLPDCSFISVVLGRTRRRSTATIKFFLLHLIARLMCRIFTVLKVSGVRAWRCFSACAPHWTEQTMIFWRSFAAFAVKVPMLRYTPGDDAHVEAHTGGSVGDGGHMLENGWLWLLALPLPIAKMPAANWIGESFACQ